MLLRIMHLALVLSTYARKMNGQRKRKKIRANQPEMVFTGSVYVKRVTPVTKFYKQ
jgi:hypothetical protein